MRRWLGLAGILALGLSASPALADDDVDLSGVVKTACAGINDPTAEKPVPLFRVAEAILYASGYPPSLLIGDTPLSRSDYADAVLAAVTNPPATIDPPTRRTIGHYVLRLGQDLGPGSNVTAKARGMRVTSPLPADTSARGGIFRPEVTLSCTPGKLPPQTVVAQLLANEKDAPRVGLIDKIEDLALTGDDRRRPCPRRSV